MGDVRHQGAIVMENKANKANKEIKVISLLNDDKWESCTKELMPSNVVNNNSDKVSINFNINLIKKLKTGMISNSFVYTHNLRGIGKTTTLVNLAEMFNLYILCKTLTQKNILKNDYNFSNARTLDEARGRIQYTFVIDEGFTIDEIQDLRDKKGINVVTGFIDTLERKEVKDTDKENTKNMDIKENQYNDNINVDELIGALNYEIKGLLAKLRRTRDSNDVGTYKNLVQALTNVLNAKQSIKENNYNNFEREKELGILNINN